MKCSGTRRCLANKQAFRSPKHVILYHASQSVCQVFQARLKMGEKWREHGLIFSNTYGGFFNPSYVWYLFKKLLKEADLPNVRFHDLRHSAATLLLAAKIDLKVVSELLGHSSIAITADIYGHVLPEMQREIINKMDDLFERS